MKRSDEDVDRLLRDWDAVASTVRQPHTDPRRTVVAMASMPFSLVVVAVVAIAVVALVGRGTIGPAVDGSPSASGPAVGVQASPAAHAAMRDDRFQLDLTIAQERYIADEDILAAAMVTYIGPEDSVVAAHAASAVVFSVREVGGDRSVTGGTRLSCVTSTWNRGVARAFPWERSGGYSATGQTDKDRFVQAYLEDGPSGGLRLPAGTWDLSATLDLAIGPGCGASQPMTVSLTIVVDPATAAQSPSATGISPAPSALPSATSPASAPPPSPEVAASGAPSVGPSATAGAPGAMVLGPVVRCGRIAAADCEGAIALARRQAPAAYAASTLILVDDTCRPDVICDRYYPFAAVVVLWAANSPTSTATTVFVHGLTYHPEAADGPGSGPIPEWMVATMEQGLQVAPGVELFPVAAGLPRFPNEVRACPAALIEGVIAEDPASGIGLGGHGAWTGSVTWPFGYAGRRDADGVALVDIAGDIVGRVGDSFTGGGGYVGDPEIAVVCE